MDVGGWGTTRQLDALLAELMAPEFGGELSEHGAHERLGSATAVMADLLDRFVDAVVEADGRVRTDELETAVGRTRDVLGQYLAAYEAIAVGLPATYPSGAPVGDLLTTRQAIALHSVGRPPVLATPAEQTAILFPCPECGAKPGDHCVTRGRWYAPQPHYKRLPRLPAPSDTPDGEVPA